MPPGAETVARKRPATRQLRDVPWLQALRAELGPILAGSVLPFVLVFYLALKGGGYDGVVRGEIGIAVWWVVLLGAVVGALPAGRMTRAAWAGVGVLAAITLWTGLGISWSESSERSVVELARVATYLGVFVLAVSAQGRDGLKRTVYSVGAALAAVAALALLSRFHPSWFPPNDAGATFEAARSRLNYPVNYWNGLATMMAMGIPLLLVVAIDARRIVTQALATAALPVMALAAFYTLSRGGAAETALALIAFLALYPRRLAALPTLLLAAGGSALLILAATQRDALQQGLSGPTALTQGDQMLVITVVVCAGVALVRVAIGLAARYGLGPRPRLSRNTALAAAAAAAVVAALAFVGLGGPGEISDRWQEFKQPGGPEAANTTERFESASGSGRYQHWQAAFDANATDPLIGIGPGTYEYFWAEHGSLPVFVRDAHSLFFESLAELGIIGLLLIGGLVFGVVAYGVRRSFALKESARPWLAAATAACVAFAAAAAIDWVWELAVIPVAFLLLAAGLLSERRPSEEPSAVRSPLARPALAVLAVLALVAIAIPLAGTSAVQASQDEVGAGRLGPALDSAREAGDIEPWASTPLLQQALVLELQGQLEPAAAAARAAAQEEPENWRTWLVLSRIEAYRGRPEAAVHAYEKARSLNPRSALFMR